MSDIGNRIRKERMDRGLSQRGLDKLAGLTSGHTHWIEVRGETITVETATAIAAALEVSVGWLIDGKE